MRRFVALTAILSVCLAGCAADSTSYRLFAPRTKPQPLAAQNDYRVMSFNLRTKFILDAHNHWNNRKHLVVQTIKRFSPDLLGTQECTIDQAVYLKAKLPGYQFVGAGRDDGKADGEMCAIFYRADRFVLLDKGHFWLSETPHVPGSKSWGSSYERMVSWVKLAPRNGVGDAFYFFNTHLDNNASRARVQQAWLLRRMIDAIADGRPVIVTGDFNTDADTTPYQLLVRGPQDWRGYLIDTYRQVHPVPSEQERTRHNFRGGTVGDRIDWIITTNNFMTLDARIDRTQYQGRFPSDHYPVTAVLRMKPGSQFAGHRSARAAGS
ncbi:MAG: endonuclease/exonuclease/phosphatase family protein [Phycisphaeraceae bacterium]